MAETTYIGAINGALAAELRRDATVRILGEDVAEGGPFGATKDLAAEFGDRVRDTPISESTVMGIATGMALAGLRPVVEIMFIDFITLAFDQLVNQAAKARYMSGGQLRCPLVVRTSSGAGTRSGAQHSQSLEALLVHVPGLAVAMPATAADAAGLLMSAIRADDPVVVIENKELYFRKEPSFDPAPVPLGSALVRRPGRDVTLVATSRTVHEALAAAEDLARDGIEVEVIDPRTLQPLDLGTILSSVRRTHRCVVAHEAVRRGGFGAELASLVQEEAFDALDAPVVRLGAPATPVPVSPPLEDAYLVRAPQIVSAIRSLLNGSA
ncbi:MAG: alpha-ketoacid dehydrogenase subunit beta [Chloroflexota bacterium]|nr:alpha-ketoacid dehydrogenase subunit beta [Chloroflexota bacterium]MDE3102757.1 alpha-ketoacid dehydrogenase subunit beta [Chloroflexota bacterium]